MWVKPVNAKGGMIFYFRFEDLQEVNAYLTTVKNCNNSIPQTYKDSTYDRVIRNLEARMKKCEDDKFKSYLYADEIGCFVTFCSPILSAAECFLDLTVDQLKYLYNL